MAQYQLTDKSIFALGADGKGAVILSKVPKHGADEIRISRLGKDGKLVLKDKTGGVLEAAFGKDTYRWDGKTALTNVLQKYSFANRGFVGGATDSGSKTTHRNISVTGAEWQPVAQGAARGPNKATLGRSPTAAGPMGRLQRQLESLQGEVAALSTPSPKAKATPMSKTKKTKGKGKGKGKAKSPAKSPISFSVTAANREELGDKLRILLNQIESDRKKKKRPASSAASSAASSPAYRSPPAKKAKVFVPEPVVQDLTENKTHESFTAGKSVVAAHYTKVTEEMPDAKMTVKQLRQELIDNMYSEDELRELADGAEIQHARISKLQTLRERLTEHFAELLPESE